MGSYFTNLTWCTWPMLGGATLHTVSRLRFSVRLIPSRQHINPNLEQAMLDPCLVRIVFDATVERKVYGPIQWSPCFLFCFGVGFPFRSNYPKKVSFSHGHWKFGPYFAARDSQNMGQTPTSTIWMGVKGLGSRLWFWGSSPFGVFWCCNPRFEGPTIAILVCVHFEGPAFQGFSAGHAPGPQRCRTQLQQLKDKHRPPDLQEAKGLR